MRKPLLLSFELPKLYVINFIITFAEHNRYIKEGNTASVMGILRKHENLIMIDPPEDIVSTGCQWRRFFFPMSVEGLILIGDERPDEVVYQV